MTVQIPTRDLFIDGDWVAPVKGERYPVINPATEGVIGSIPLASAEDVDRAVSAAVRVQKQLRKTTGAQRALWLRSIAAYVRFESRSDTALARAVL